MKGMFTIIVALCISMAALAQNKNRNEKPNDDSTRVLNLVIGGNYFYYPETEVINGVDYDTRYQEHTFSINAATDITKHIRLGLDYKKLYTKGVLTGKNDYSLLGAVGQYRVFVGDVSFGFLELGYYKGNYCTCGEDLPFKREGITYVNWGGGANFKLKKRLWLDLAFTTAQVASKIPGRYGYTQLIIGLNYDVDVIKWRR